MSTSNQKQPFEIQVQLPVRTYDIDFAGVVNNIVYVRWLEDLRLEMLTRHFPLDEQLKNGIAPVIVKTTVDYKRPIKLSDSPSGKMWIKTIEAVRWTINAVIAVDGNVVALGEQVGIFVDLQNNRPIRMPEVLKQKYQGFVA